MEIKLTNVGRASLEELLRDYRDYLRVRDHVLLGQGIQGSPLRPAAGLQDPADL
jgi:hypothetical protein